MEKAHSSKLYEQAANQDKEADSHVHKIFSEVSAWFNTSLQANQTKTEAFQQSVSENVDATNAAFKESCEAVSNGFHSIKAELKREDPELVNFLHKAQHAPEIAAHRIADFYKTRPLTAAIETIIPPVAIVDGIIRGGLPQHKVVQKFTPAPEHTQS
ncbi:MAG TPA: hypothetical protein V6C97_24145 [Oculatellaceae cyanobacterium]